MTGSDVPPGGTKDCRAAICVIRVVKEENENTRYREDSKLLKIFQLVLSTIIYCVQLNLLAVLFAAWRETESRK